MHRLFHTLLILAWTLPTCVPQGTTGTKDTRETRVIKVPMVSNHIARQ